MAVSTTLTSSKGWSPDLHFFPAAEIIPEALIMQTSTIAGAIEGDEPAVRVPFVDDAEADFVAEGETIPESDPTLAEVVVHTGKVSQLIRVSREQLSQPNASERLSESVARAVTNRANEAYLSQPAPTSPATTPPTGLLNIDGIIDGGTIDTDLDVLADAFASIETNKGTVTNIIAAPDAWGSLRKMKTGTGNATTLLGAGTNDATKMLLGVPVITSHAAPSGTLVVMDRTAVVSAVGDLQVQSSDQVYFTSDSIGIRCTWRFGQNFVRPNRVAKLTVTPPEE
ncbi:HK97 family phage major capsid protein [Brevibacterium epidermidis]|jgi:HK97 family phage major capsid protein|uniref:HK97 family phage major capsid protein n=1 Tax=Brevibacterium epidermidis TaxID=1698 RepID=A0ABV4EPF0_BREEP